MKKTLLDYNSAERLWKMFFPKFDRIHGIALVQDLWALRKIVALLMVAALLALPARAQTTNTNPPANFFPAGLGVSGSLENLITAVGNSDLLQATNWAAAPYLTYAPQAQDKVGGGFLAVYNMPALTSSLGSVGAALGADWLGSWSLVSGNVTLQVPTHPLAHLGILQGIIPASITNTVCTPFAVAGIGTPMSGNGSAATIWDLGYQIQFGHFAGGKFGAGITWGEWMNAGVESSHRYHFFLSYQKGF